MCRKLADKLWQIIFLNGDKGPQVNLLQGEVNILEIIMLMHIVKCDVKASGLHRRFQLNRLIKLFPHRKLSFCPKASIVCEWWVLSHIWVILPQVGPNGQLTCL
jgi:hypothetical protein